MIGRYIHCVDDDVIDQLNKNAPGATSAKINEPGAVTSSAKPEAAWT